jgi:hypothetical protein
VGIKKPGKTAPRSPCRRIVRNDLAHHGVRMYRNPQLREAADAMAVILRDLGYTPHARDQVVRRAVAHGTPTGSEYLDREDEDAATEAFVGAMPEVALDSNCWDRDGGAV